MFSNINFNFCVTDAKAWFDKFEEAKAIVKDVLKPPSGKF
jgi:hypothetical protein